MRVVGFSGGCCHQTSSKLAASSGHQFLAWMSQLAPLRVKAARLEEQQELG